MTKNYALIAHTSIPTGLTHNTLNFEEEYVQRGGLLAAVFI